jgi:Zn-dependent protease with chaperone function
MNGPGTVTAAIGAFALLLCGGVVVGIIARGTSAAAGWAIAMTSVAALYLGGRFAAQWTRTPALPVVVGALGAVVGVLLAVVVESVPRRAGSPVATLGLAAIVCGGILAALVLPVVALGLGMWQRRVTDFSRPRTVPLVIAALMWLAVLATNLFVLAVILLFTPPRWLGAAAVATIVGMTVGTWPAWGTFYASVLRRWKSNEPAALSDALMHLHDRTGFAFSRVLCLDHGFGSDNTCEVVLTVRGWHLVISAGVIDTLTSRQLLALLAHEAAHILFRHGVVKAVAALAATAGSVVAGGVAALALSWIMPNALRVLPGLAMGISLVLARGLFNALVSRRHEFEADDFAAAVAGADAVTSALEALNLTGPTAAMTHNRWTSHGTWDLRAARLRNAAGPQEPREWESRKTD